MVPRDSFDPLVAYLFYMNENVIMLYYDYVIYEYFTLS